MTDKKKDETELIESNPTMMERLSKSLKQLEEGNVIETSLDELKKLEK